MGVQLQGDCGMSDKILPIRNYYFKPKLKLKLKHKPKLKRKPKPTLFTKERYKNNIEKLINVLKFKCIEFIIY